MNIDLIYTKIKDFEQRKSKLSGSEVLSYLKNRLKEVEQYISEVELNNAEFNYKLQQKDELIDILVKLLIITGNADKLTLDLNSEHVRQSIDLLLKNKDRNNHTKISLIGYFLSNIGEVSTLNELHERIS
jgi:Icc-related predicted phosphoesterase